MCLKRLFERHAAKFGGLEIFRYIGPGFLVTVGFINPGNWASNLAAGSVLRIDAVASDFVIENLMQSTAMQQIKLVQSGFQTFEKLSKLVGFFRVRPIASLYLSI